MAARRRHGRWWHWPRRIALVVATPFLLILFIASLPFVLPFVGIAQTRLEKRRRACAERWRCGWCVAPLGADALARADTLFGAYVDLQFGHLGKFRTVRDLHACCPRCSAGHRYDGQADAFTLLDAREFAAMFEPLLATAVDLPGLALAWPWLPHRTASHMIALTRGSEEGDMPEEGMVEVPAEVDVVAIGEALLRSPWLAPVGDTATWSAVAGPVTLTFGLQAGMPFVRRTGSLPVRADSVGTLHVRHVA